MMTMNDCHYRWFPLSDGSGTIVGKIMKYLSLLFILLLAAAGCDLSGSQQKLESEATDALPVNTVTSANILLNMEPFGTTDDLSSLTKMLGSIMLERKNEGVFRFGSNEVENRVFVFADNKISIGKFAALILGIKSASAEPIILNEDHIRTHKNDLSMRPNPLTLVVRAGDAEVPEFIHADYLDNDDPGIENKSDFTIIDDRKELKIRRIVGNSIEISADGRHFVNEKHDRISEDSTLADFTVKQRPIESSALSEEIRKSIVPVPGGQPSLLVIASENASYESLKRILEAADDPNINFNILVRRISKKQD